MGVPNGKWNRWMIVAGSALVGAFLLSIPTVYEENHYVCANTLSRRGHTEWPFGIESSHWQTASPLEEFLTTHAPDSIIHDWTFSHTAGKNLFGRTTIHADGAPPIGHMIAWNHLDAWIAVSSKEDVLDLYEFLKARHREQIREKIADINESWLKAKNIPLPN